MKIFEKSSENEHSVRKIYRRYYTFLGPLIGKPKAKAYTYLGISCLTVAFFIFFAIRPTINTIIGLQKQIKDNKEVESKLQEKISALSQLQAEYEIIQADLPILDTALPVKPNIDELIKTVEKLAFENQASLSAMQVGEAILSENNVEASQSTQPEPQKAKSKTVSMPISKPAIPINLVFTTESNYGNITKIVAGINRLPRLYAIQNITMMKNLDKVLASIKVYAYYLPVK
jgi:Tfp pilus assembly protein PilO